MWRLVVRSVRRGSSTRGEVPVQCPGHGLSIAGRDRLEDGPSRQPGGSCVCEVFAPDRHASDGPASPVRLLVEPDPVGEPVGLQRPPCWSRLPRQPPQQVGDAGDQNRCAKDPPQDGQGWVAKGKEHEDNSGSQRGHVPGCPWDEHGHRDRRPGIRSPWTVDQPRYAGLMNDGTSVAACPAARCAFPEVGAIGVRAPTQLVEHDRLAVGSGFRPRTHHHADVVTHDLRHLEVASDGKVEHCGRKRAAVDDVSVCAEQGADGGRARRRCCSGCWHDHTRPNLPAPPDHLDSDCHRNEHHPDHHGQDRQHAHRRDLDRDPDEGPDPPKQVPSRTPRGCQAAPV